MIVKHSFTWAWASLRFEFFLCLEQASGDSLVFDTLLSLAEKR